MTDTHTLTLTDDERDIVMVSDMVGSIIVKVEALGPAALAMLDHDLKRWHDPEDPLMYADFISAARRLVAFQREVAKVYDSM